MTLRKICSTPTRSVSEEIAFLAHASGYYAAEIEHVDIAKEHLARQEPCPPTRSSLRNRALRNEFLPFLNGSAALSRVACRIIRDGPAFGNQASQVTESQFPDRQVGALQV